MRREENTELMATKRLSTVSWKYACREVKVSGPCKMRSEVQIFLRLRQISDYMIAAYMRVL
jgi:hypothetical protein